MKRTNEFMDILERDRTGICKGECRNIILEGMMNRQKAIAADPLKAPDYFPDVPWARKRNDQPGWLGGHV